MTALLSWEILIKVLLHLDNRFSLFALANQPISYETSTNCINTLLIDSIKLLFKGIGTFAWQNHATFIRHTCKIPASGRVGSYKIGGKSVQFVSLIFQKNISKPICQGGARAIKSLKSYSDSHFPRRLRFFSETMTEPDVPSSSVYTVNTRVLLLSIATTRDLVAVGTKLWTTVLLGPEMMSWTW